MAKRKSGVETNCGKEGESSLKGLERRTRQGRRETPRRKSDSKADAGQGVTEPQPLLLADEAAALVTHCYEELFGLFPEALTACRNPDADDRGRELTAALALIVKVLHRQDERVKVLKELELENRDDATQSNHCAAIAETLLGLMTDFSSDSWTGAFEQVRVARR